jgi:hypothetical protein
MRGKYKSTAEARRAREGAEAKAVRLERENGALHRENERLRIAAEEQHAGDLAEIKAVRVALATGAEPGLADLQAKYAALWADLLDYEVHVSDVQDMHEKGCKFLMGHFQAVHQFTERQAWEILGTAYGRPPEVGVLPSSMPTNTRKKLSSERIEVVRAVRNHMDQRRRARFQGLVDK